MVTWCVGRVLNKHSFKACELVMTEITSSVLCSYITASMMLTFNTIISSNSGDCTNENEAAPSDDDDVNTNIDVDTNIYVDADVDDENEDEDL